LQIADAIDPLGAAERTPSDGPLPRAPTGGCRHRCATTLWAPGAGASRAPRQPCYAVRATYLGARAL